MTPMVIAIAITVITAAIIIAFWVTMFRTFRRSSHIMLFIWCAILSAALYEAIWSKALVFSVVFRKKLCIEYAMVFLMGRLFGRWKNLSALADEKSEIHAI